MTEKLLTGTLSLNTTNQPAHEILALFVLGKLILQTIMTAIVMLQVTSIATKIPPLSNTKEQSPRSPMELSVRPGPNSHHTHTRTTSLLCFPMTNLWGLLIITAGIQTMKAALGATLWIGRPVGTGVQFQGVTNCAFQSTVDAECFEILLDVCLALLYVLTARYKHTLDILKFSCQ